MEVQVTQENLSKALSNVGRVASSKADLQILGNILLRTDGNQLCLAATNLEIASTEKIGAKIIKHGSVTIPARLITELVQNLPKETLTLTVKNSILHIETQGNTSTVNGMSDEEFPELPVIDESQTVKYEITVGDFKEASSQTLITASNDATRPVLTGVYWHTFEGNLYFVATDGYRLTERRVMKAEADLSVIVPVSTIQEVLRTIDDDNEAVEVLFDDSQVRFRVNDNEITSRLIDGAFPDYRQLIPNTTATTIQFERADLQRAVKVTSLFSSQTAKTIQLEVDTKAGQVKISSVASELGKNDSIISTESKGESGVVSVNSRYLLDALSVVGSDAVTFSFSGKLAPCVIAPIDEKLGYKHIIMPVKS